MKDIFLQADEHKGASFVEIYQNCPVFNDGAFNAYTDRGLKDENTLFIEVGKPMTFHKDKKGIVLDKLKPKVVDLTSNEYSVDDCLVHDPSDRTVAYILSQFFDNDKSADLPRVFGVIYSENRPTYEDQLSNQVELAIEEKGEGDLDALIAGPNTWYHQ
jgi:2-oxoglutarate ferredoxin oxidoreductase subunit beta